MNNSEAWIGIEPTYKSFADSCLTTWLPGHVEIRFKLPQVLTCFSFPLFLFSKLLSNFGVKVGSNGVEPFTSSLSEKRSTAELTAHNLEPKSKVFYQT